MSKEQKESDDDFKAILDELSKPLPPEAIKQRVGWTDRNGRQHDVDYIEWHTAADMLDAAWPEWSHEVISITQIGDFVAVIAGITIQGITRQGVGTGSAYDEKGIKKAEHDALKRAAIKFGLARELYRGHVEGGDAGTKGEKMKKPAQMGKPREPIAKTMSDLVTPKQLVAIRAIANAHGINAEAQCSEQLKCMPEELSRKAASWFIDYLKEATPESLGRESEEQELRDEARTIDVDFQDKSPGSDTIIKRARVIAALKLVNRDYEGFNVIAPGIQKETYRVWRDEEGRVRCNCPVFETGVERESRFRCEHILAVKFYLEPPGDAAEPTPITEKQIADATQIAKRKKLDLYLEIRAIWGMVESIESLTTEQGILLLDHLRGIQG